MKWLAILIAICFAGCTIYDDRGRAYHITPQTKKKVYKKKYYSKPTKKGKPSIRQPGGTIVNAQWIESYKRLEKEYDHTVSDDANIKPMGEKFLVPKAVIDHFNDLSHTEPTP